MMLFGAKPPYVRFAAVEVLRVGPYTSHDTQATWAYEPVDKNMPSMAVFWRQYLEREVWTVVVNWPDGAKVLGFGPTFDDAKRDCVRMLSERSREVGRTQ